MFGPDVDLDDEVVVVGGARFAEADAEVVSAEIARDKSLNNLIPGRKSLSGNGKHSPVINVRVSETTRRRLEELAAAHGASISKLARQAIEEFVNSN